MHSYHIFQRITTNLLKTINIFAFLVCINLHLSHAIMFGILLGRAIIVKKNVNKHIEYTYIYIHFHKDDIT